MNDRAIFLAKLLTYSGTLPFIVATLALLFEPIHASIALRYYAAVIVSFLAGIHWAVFLLRSDSSPSYLLVASNVIALLAWLALLVPPLTKGLIFLCFVGLLWIDWRLAQQGLWTTWYFQLRCRATIIVLLCWSVFGLLPLIG